MGHYTGPKARINRRLGTLIYESSGAARAMDRRDNPPGMHTRQRRPSNYGLALMEKQKIKHYYGLGERQLRRYFDSVSRGKGNAGEMLLIMCERRLDNVVRRCRVHAHASTSSSGHHPRALPGQRRQGHQAVLSDATW